MPHHDALRTLALLLAFSSAACSGALGSSDGGDGSEDGDGRGSLAIVITDAPIDPSLVASAVIEVDAIRVHREADGESGFVTVYEGRPRPVELTNLRNGLTEGFAAGLLEPGEYGQARLHVTDARLELDDGRVFSTRDGTIQLTSQDTSGYKIFFDPPVVVYPNVETRVLLDIDVPKTFSPIPANDLDSARSFHLHPNVRPAVLQETGELRGVVTTTDDLGATIPADTAAVYVLAPGETDPERAVATTLTDSNGQAAVLGMPAGTWDVLAELDGRSGRVEGLVVSVGSVTSFELALE